MVVSLFFLIEVFVLSATLGKRKLVLLALSLFLGLLCSSVLYAAEVVKVSEFALDGLKGWEEHSFEGNTRYRVDAAGSESILKAVSAVSASGLVKELRVDLNETPYLNWRWKVDEALVNLAEDTKVGDDYAARIYVIVDGGWLFWRTKALNFVWSSGDRKNTRWPNAFAPDNALMVALRDHSDGINRWQYERVNVKQLLEEWLGDSVSHIDAIAIMTDTDNSGLSAAASFGDLYFSSE